MSPPEMRGGSAAASPDPALPPERRLALAQDALEEKEFALLELQSAHVRALRELRKESEAKDARMRELIAEARAARAEARTVESASLRAGAAADEERARLIHEIETLRLQVDEARAAAADAHAQRKASAGRGVGEADLARLQRALASRDEEAAALRAELSSKVSALVAREAELEEVRSHSLAQEARVRALHDQLATFISKDAQEAARAQVSGMRQRLALPQWTLFEAFSARG